MAIPSTSVRVDWANTGSFSTFAAVDTIPSPMVVRISRGRSGDTTSEAQGSLSLTVRNDNDFFTRDRNWCDNPSFEYGTTGWRTAAVASLTAAATSISQVTDSAAGSGTQAGEAVLTATSGSGVVFPIPYRFRNGVAHSISFWIKSMSGTTSVQCGIASESDPTEIATGAGTITASWAEYTLTYTPTGDNTDAVLFVRTTAAAAATVRIDCIGVNPGASLNTYIEAPTRGQLDGGRPIHVQPVYDAVTYAKFYGYIERITPNFVERTVTISALDPLKRMSTTPVIVPAHAYHERSARSFRMWALEDYERGNLNLLTNTSFETNTTGWTATAGTLTRTTTDAAPNAGSAYMEFNPASAGNQCYAYPYLAPIYMAGMTFRFAVWLRNDSGNNTVKIGIGTDLGAGSANQERTVSTTATWSRHSVTYTLPATVTASGATPLAVWIEATDGNNIRIDAAMVSRGEERHGYVDEGTGRWANFCGNGDFEGGGTKALTLAGWYDAFANMIGNPSIETDTTGWSQTADAFHTTSATLTRLTSDGAFGSACLAMGTAGTDGCHYAITGTFASGVTYNVGVYLKLPTGTDNYRIGIGSQGTPADFAESSNLSPNTSWQWFRIEWTPTGSRTDAHFYVRNMGAGGTIRIDAASVFRRDANAPDSPDYPSYVDQGPGSGAGSFVTSTAMSTTAKYGARSHQWASPATAGAGRIYDFNHYGAVFVSGKPYTVSVWIRPTSSMAYKVGIAADKGDGTYDEASTTGTATADTWNQVTVTWTPSADRTSVAMYDIVLYVWQTDATARTVRIDGVRVIPGSAADDFEMAQWDLAVGAEANDLWLATASLDGTALAVLSQINDLTLTRHWTRALTASPWYQYATEDRDTFSTKNPPSVTFDGADILGNPENEVDLSGVYNLVTVTYSTAGEETYADEDSGDADRYGPRSAPTISGRDIYPDATIPDEVGPGVIERYAEPLARLRITRKNDYTNQLTLDLNDNVAVTSTRALLTSAEYVILTEDLTILPLDWETTWRTEEYAY